MSRSPLRREELGDVHKEYGTVRGNNVHVVHQQIIFFFAIHWRLSKPRQLMMKFRSVRADILSVGLYGTSLTANVRGVIDARPYQLSRRWKLTVSVNTVVVEAM